MQPGIVTGIIGSENAGNVAALCSRMVAKANTRQVGRHDIADDDEDVDDNNDATGRPAWKVALWN